MGAIIEVRNTLKTSSELLYFQLESFCLVWAHHFHIYGDLSKQKYEFRPKNNINEKHFHSGRYFT